MMSSVRIGLESIGILISAPFSSTVIQPSTPGAPLSVPFFFKTSHVALAYRSVLTSEQEEHVVFLVLPIT